MENPFLEDAIYCLRRASRALSVGMDRDSFYDAALYYAFGMEKLFKAIVYSVNPVFLLESNGFENAVYALYGERLIDRQRKKAEKDVNRSLIPFQASMLRAAKFSEAVEDNIGKLTKLADVRGALAHRSWEEIEIGETADFLLLTFAPMVELFAKEVGFDPNLCFDSASKRKRLKAVSKDLAAQNNYEEYIKGVLAKHLAIWTARKDSQEERDKAGSMTQSYLNHFTPGGPYSSPTNCPCCRQAAVLEYRFISRYGENEVSTIGAYAVGLTCLHCDIQLYGYKAIDYFKLNDLVEAFFREAIEQGGL